MSKASQKLKAAQTAAVNNKAKTAKASAPRKLIANNKKAYHEYHVLDTMMAGVVLLGTEIKSIRLGKVSMLDAFARIEKNEIFLYGLNISPYEKAAHFNHEPTRTRKLLLNKAEIRKLEAKIKQSGLTLVPTRLVLDRCWVKVELGLCQGKKQHDKRDAVAERDAQRTIQRTMKQAR